jgi:peptide/nickel transport system substrate-binding protein
MIKSPLSQLKEIAPDRKTLRGRLRRMERVSLRHAHKFLVRRVSNLRDVRRHALSWVLLVALVSGIAVWQTNVSAAHYTAEVPAEAGIYTEGVFGAIDNLNPIFVATPAERSGSRLIFANLLDYDNKGDLVGELAERWWPEEDGKAYMVELRPNARWHDGQPVTADDIVFTFQLIKNADTRSPLYASWRNIGVKKIDPKTVRFGLPAPYAAFPTSLAIGMVPRHILQDIRPSELRTEPFNREPRVGSGPFTFQDLRAVDSAQQHYILRTAVNKDYVLGEPKLDGFQMHAYKDREDLAKAFRTQEVASVSDLTLTQLKNLGNTGNYTQIDAPIYSGVYAFLNTENPILGDSKVRRALQLATDTQAIVDLYDNSVEALEGPLLPGQLGYRAKTRQPKLNLARANQLLDEAGWKMAKDSTRRTKNGQSLRLQMATVSSGDYPAIVEELMNQWRKVGVEFEPNLVKAEEIQQNVILPRAYDVLIYEIVIGRDPDVYAYWHSSQATERGFNLSNYNSPTADDALDSARTRLDPALRDAKYAVFAQQWIDDAPAIGLYRPSLAYVQNNSVVTFQDHALVDPTDRYYNIRYWAAGRELLRPTR